MALRRTALFSLLTFLFLFHDSAHAGKIPFAINWVPQGHHAHFYVTPEKGFFQDAGLDVDVLRGYGSGDTARRVVQKQVLLGFADAPAVVITRARGGGIKLIGIIADRGMNALYALEGSGIRTPKDLSGRSIGEAQAGACIAVFPALAKLHGITGWKHQVMDPAAKDPSLLAGKVDSICTFVSNGVALRIKGQKAGKRIVEMTFADYGLDMAGSGLIARDETIQGEPDLLRRFVGAVYKATAWTVEHPEEAMDVFLRLHPTMDRTIARAQWEVAARHLMTETAKKHGIGYMDPAKMAKTAELVVQYTPGVPPVKAEDVYTNAFLPKLFPKYKPMM